MQYEGPLSFRRYFVTIIKEEDEFFLVKRVIKYEGDLLTPVFIEEKIGKKNVSRYMNIAPIVYSVNNEGVLLLSAKYYTKYPFCTMSLFDNKLLRDAFLKLLKKEKVSKEYIYEFKKWMKQDLKNECIFS